MSHEGYLEGQIVKAEPARTVIKVNLGATINIGNFQSVRIEVGIEDYRRRGETADTAFDRVYSFVENKLTDKINETVRDVERKVT